MRGQAHSQKFAMGGSDFKDEKNPDMSIVVEVERAFGWPRLWDLTLDNGAKCVEGLRNLVRVITFPSHAMQACPLCVMDEISRDSLLYHVLDSHTNCRLSSTELLQDLLSVTDADSTFFNHLYMYYFTGLFQT